MRKKNGSHYLAKKIFDYIDQDHNETPFRKVVIDSIRNDKEVKYLKQYVNFFLIAMHADEDTRFRRWYNENKERSRHFFEKIDRRDTEEIEEYGQKVEKCTYDSDIIINNDEEIDTKNPIEIKQLVEKSLDNYLELIEKGPKIAIRPKIDEKLMTLAYMESLFSSCIQRKVGAVICSNDGAVISSGYNHVPFSEKTCAKQYGRCYRRYLSVTTQSIHLKKNVQTAIKQ